MGIVAVRETYFRGPDGKPSGGGGSIPWLTPRGVPGFARRKMVQPGSREFSGLMGLAIAAGRRGLSGLGATDPCGNTGEIIGPNGQCTLPQYLPLNYISNPNVPAVPGAVAVSLYRTNPAVVGGCPVIDAKNNVCAYGSTDGTIGCNELRECDGIVGSAVHYAYALPGGPDPNVDINVAGRGYQGNPNNANYLGPAAAIAAASSAPPPTGGGGGTGSGGNTGNATATPVTLQFVNVTRPGMPLRVLDQWALTVMGTPNSPVTIDATHDGKQVGTGTPFGSTDSSGKKVITGTMTADTVGSWNETVRVGGLSAALAFVVASAASGAAPPPPTDTGGGGSTSTDNNSGTDPGTTSRTSGCYQFFGGANDDCIGPVGKMTALAGLGLVAAAYFLFGGRRR